MADPECCETIVIIEENNVIDIQDETRDMVIAQPEENDIIVKEVETELIEVVTEGPRGADFDATKSYVWTASQTFEETCTFNKDIIVGSTNINSNEISFNNDVTDAVIKSNSTLSNSDIVLETNSGSKVVIKNGNVEHNISSDGIETNAVSTETVDFETTSIKSGTNYIPDPQLGDQVEFVSPNGSTFIGSLTDAYSHISTTSANGLSLENDVTIAGDVVPNDNTRSLGTSTSKWDEVNVETMNSQYNDTVNSDVRDSLTVGGESSLKNTNVDGNLTVVGDILSDGSNDIGTQTEPFGTIYADGSGLTGTIVHETREINTNNGIVGGGDLSTDRTLGLDTDDTRNVDHASVSFNGTNGISGGGDLTTGATFDINVSPLGGMVSDASGVRVDVLNSAQITEADQSNQIFIDDGSGIVKRITLQDLSNTSSTFVLRGSVTLDENASTGVIHDEVEGDFNIDENVYPPYGRAGFVYTVDTIATNNTISGKSEDYVIGDFLLLTPDASQTWDRVASGVDSFNGRLGKVVPLELDYQPWYPSRATSETISGDWTFNQTIYGRIIVSDNIRSVLPNIADVEYYPAMLATSTAQNETQIHTQSDVSYNPLNQTLTAPNFIGDGSGLTDINAGDGLENGVSGEIQVDATVARRDVDNTFNDVTVNTITGDGTNLTGTVVHTDQDQTISGIKTHSSDIVLNNSVSVEGKLVDTTLTNVVEIDPSDILVVGDIQQAGMNLKSNTRPQSTVGANAPVDITLKGDPISDFVNDENFTSWDDNESITGDWEFDGDLRYNGSQVHIGLDSGETSQGIQTVAIGTGSGNLLQGDGSIAIGSLAGNESQGLSSVAIGPFAGRTLQSAESVAVGVSAGQTSQGDHTVAVGTFAGQNAQGADSVAVGTNAGNNNQAIRSIAIGKNSGNGNQGTLSVAVGDSAGSETQGTKSVAVGSESGQYEQGDNTIAIGTTAGQVQQGLNSVAIGTESGLLEQSINAVAVGSGSGKTRQGTQSVAIGTNSAENGQGDNAIAVGYRSGYTFQGNNCTSLGSQAGEIDQGENSVAVGLASGQDNQGLNSVAVGSNSGQTQQGDSSIAIGFNSGQTTQGTRSISVGTSAGQINQSYDSIAFGTEAGTTNQSNDAVAIGTGAGKTEQSTSTVAIGSNAGSENQYSSAVAIGRDAGYISQGSGGIAVGSGAGRSSQNAASIAIGRDSANSNQGSSSIAMGWRGGYSSQGDQAVTIGVYSGYYSQGVNSVAVGALAARNYQGDESVAIGANSGGTSQSDYSVAIGSNSGKTSQGEGSVSVGYYAGFSSQGAQSVAVGLEAGETRQGDATIAIGNKAGNVDQSANSVAIGQLAGENTQGLNSIAIGNDSGQVTQGAESIAIGTSSGKTSQGTHSTSIGFSSGEITQGDYTTSIGYLSGQDQQGDRGVAIGANAAQTLQSVNSVAIGSNSGQTSQGNDSVAVGADSGNSNQGNESVAIGSESGQITQGASSVAIGRKSGENLQGGESVAIGALAGQDRQGSDAVAIGTYSGYNQQGDGSLAMGYNSGAEEQGDQALAIGNSTGFAFQGNRAIALGYASGYENQGENSISIGDNSAFSGQSSKAISLGYYTGNMGQGASAVAIGNEAGKTSQGTSSVAIGDEAGKITQGTQSVAIGDEAGAQNQGENSVAIGRTSGQTSQGVNSISVGYSAGQTSQGNSSVAVGLFSGQNSQGQTSVAVGLFSGQNSQGVSSVSIGDNSGSDTQGTQSVAIGCYSGNVTQSDESVAIGCFSGRERQGERGVAIGYASGSADQDVDTVAVGYAAGNVNQSLNSVAVGSSAGRNDQSSNSVAVGRDSGFTSQGASSVAMGRDSGKTTQGNLSVAVGAYSGSFEQSSNSTAIGYASGQTSQGINATAVGYVAGNDSQGDYSVAIGTGSGQLRQLGNSVAIGRESGQTDQGTQSVAVGFRSGQLNKGNHTVSVGAYSGQFTQGEYSVAIGRYSGEDQQGTQSVAIGTNAGQNIQSDFAVAIGSAAGITSQGSYSVAIGNLAGRTTQGNNSVSIGNQAGETEQGINSIAVGVESGSDTQGANSIAVGFQSSLNGQGQSSIAIGRESGKTTQGEYAVAIGRNTGMEAQGGYTVAIGWDSGKTTQGEYSVAIGVAAGQTGQLNNSVAVGRESGQTSQGANSVAVGFRSGENGQGENAVAIGRESGHTNQNDNSIVVSSSGVAADTTVDGQIIIRSSNANIEWGVEKTEDDATSWSLNDNVTSGNYHFDDNPVSSIDSRDLTKILNSIAITEPITPEEAINGEYNVGQVAQIEWSEGVYYTFTLTEFGWYNPELGRVLISDQNIENLKNIGTGHQPDYYQISKQSFKAYYPHEEQLQWNAIAPPYLKPETRNVGVFPFAGFLSYGNPSKLQITDKLRVVAKGVRYSGNGTRVLAGKYWDETNNREYVIFMDGDDKLRVYVTSDGQQIVSKQYVTQDVLPQGCDIDVQFDTTFEGDSLRIYINGELIVPQKLSDGDVTSIYSSTSSFQIGATRQNGNAYFSGIVCGVQVYHDNVLVLDVPMLEDFEDKSETPATLVNNGITLDERTVDLLYNVPVIDGGRAVNVACVESPSYFNFGVKPKYDLKNDISVRVKLQAYDTTQSRHDIIGKYNSNINRAWVVYLSGGQLYVYVTEDNAFTNAKWYRTTATITQTDEIGFDFTSAGNLTLFINGVVAPHLVVNGIDDPMTEMTSQDSNLIIGTSESFVSRVPFKGQIDYVRIDRIGGENVLYQPFDYDLADHSPNPVVPENTGVTLAAIDVEESYKGSKLVTEGYAHNPKSTNYVIGSEEPQNQFVGGLTVDKEYVLSVEEGTATVVGVGIAEPNRPLIFKTTETLIELIFDDAKYCNFEETVHNSMVFDGTSYLNAGNPKHLRIVDKLKIEAELKTVPTAARNPIYGKWDTEGGVIFEYLDTGQLRALLSADGSIGPTVGKIFTTNVLTLKAGDTVSMTYINGDDGDDLKIFVNGVIQNGSFGLDSPMTQIWDNDVDPVEIGKLYTFYTTGNFCCLKVYSDDDLVLDIDTNHDVYDHSDYNTPIINNGVTLTDIASHTSTRWIATGDEPVERLASTQTLHPSALNALAGTIMFDVSRAEESVIFFDNGGLSLTGNEQRISLKTSGNILKTVDIGKSVSDIREVGVTWEDDVWNVIIDKVVVIEDVVLTQPTLGPLVIGQYATTKNWIVAKEAYKYSQIVE